MRLGRHRLHFVVRCLSGVNMVSLERGSMKYRIALEKSEEGYSVSVPGLPGCWSQGDTEAEAIENIKDAITEYIATRDDLLSDAVIREVEVPI